MMALSYGLLDQVRYLTLRLMLRSRLLLMAPFFLLDFTYL